MAEPLVIEKTRTYYEVLVHEHGWNIDTFQPPDPTWPRPTRILTRCLVYPQRTYCASLTPGQWVTRLDTQAVFDAGVDLPDECREWWQQEGDFCLALDHEPGFYFDWHDCCHTVNNDMVPFEGRAFIKVGPPNIIKWEDVSRGHDEDEYDTGSAFYEEQAVEDANSNPDL